MKSIRTDVNEPLITIIVPVFNAEQYLNKCLTSLQDQTYSNIEVLMINDGSEDCSEKICQSFSEKDKRFKYFYQENAGVSSARNLGLKLASGEYIGFCDSDDWVDRDMYELLLVLIEEAKADVSICSFYWDTEAVKDKPYCCNQKFYFTSEEAMIEMHKGEKFAGHLCNKLFRRTVIGKLQLQTDVHIMEDMLFVSQIFMNSTKIIYQNVKKYHYVQAPASACNCFRERYWSIQKACELMLKMVEEQCAELKNAVQKTVLYGNIMLARAASEAGRLDAVSYKRILSQIDENYSYHAVSMLTKGERIRLEVYRHSRRLFILYVRMSKIKALRILSDLLLH